MSYEVVPNKEGKKVSATRRATRRATRSATRSATRRATAPCHPAVPLLVPRAQWHARSATGTRVASDGC